MKSGREKTQFKKGQSGNPAGRPKVDEEVLALCRERSLSSVKALLKMAAALEDHLDDPPSVKSFITIHTYIIDRAWGKPAQALQLGDKDGGPLQVIVNITGKNANA